MSKLVVMAGGTGGHVFPGLAVAHKMQQLGWSIEWIGTADKMEAQLVPAHGFKIHFIDIGGVRGKGIVTKLLTPIKLIKAFFQARRLLTSIQPNAVIGMGGYASGPGGLAAKSLSIPLIVHEQNAVFGMTNRYLAKIAQATLTGFDVSVDPVKSKAPNNTVYVGNPIREGFFDIQVSSQEARKNHCTHILIIGGSLGALALNQKVPPILLKLEHDFAIKVRHQTGKSKQEQVDLAYGEADFVAVTEFIDDMIEALSWADIIICRAGALTVAEVAGAGRAAIFVPLPIAVDDHQTANARILSDKQAGVLLPQADIEQKLYEHLSKLCSAPKMRMNMAENARKYSIKDATTKVAKVILQLTQTTHAKESH